MAKFFCLFILLITLHFSCTHEHSQHIPSEIRSYVDEFSSDAKDKGIDIDLKNFTLDVSFTSLPDAEGRCYFDGNKVQIDSNFWNRSNQIQRRFIVYHELGHCILDRRHDNTTLPNGECKSLMRGDVYNCSENLVSEKWWDYYLSELFVNNEELPAWYDLNEIPASVFIINFEKLDTTLAIDPDLERTKDLNCQLKLNPSENFQITFEYKDFPIGIIPKIKTNYFEFHQSFYGASLYLNYKNPVDPNSKMEIYSNESISFTDRNIKLTVKYKDNLMYFFTNNKLIHVSDIDFDSPISIYNLNFNFDTSVIIESGNI
jgi:hypothetical protein